MTPASRAASGVARLALCALALCAVAATASAHSYRLGALKIDHPWARPTPPGAPTGAGYFSVTNTGATPDRLLAVASPAAQAVQIHQMSMTGGIMRMREVAGGLDIAPGQTLALTPGGYHLMFVGLKTPFTLGAHIPATLTFAHAGKVAVEFYVQQQPEDGTMAGMKMK
jgi:copper(I)-binding protein